MGLLLLVVGCGGERGIMMGMLCVSQEQFGDQWPLTVPKGSLSCTTLIGRGKIVGFSVGGDHYILNANPDGLGGSLPLESIVRIEPTNPRVKMDIGVLVDEGVKLCAQYSSSEVYKVQEEYDAAVFLQRLNDKLVYFINQ